MFPRAWYGIVFVFSALCGKVSIFGTVFRCPSFAQAQVIQYCYITMCVVYDVYGESHKEVTLSFRELALTTYKVFSLKAQHQYRNEVSGYGKREMSLTP